MQESTPQQAAWYAIKVFYNKVFEIEGRLQGRGLETYLAVEKVELKGRAFWVAKKKLAEDSSPLEERYVVDGPRILLRRPLVTSLIFVKALPEQIARVDALLKEPLAGGGNPRGFIYKNVDRTAFCIIPPAQMEAFRLVVEAGAGGLEFFAEDDIARFSRGDKVRVKEGPLAGAEGYIKRIKKDRRLLVCIDGVVAVATSYIPPQFLEKI